jgi:hypothetical protein
MQEEISSALSARMPAADTVEGRVKAGKHRRTGSWFARNRGGDEQENYRRAGHACRQSPLLL